jgi:hypothetical protein
MMNAATGRHFPMLYGQGGMKILFSSVTQISTVGNIMLDELRELNFKKRS